MSNPQPTLDPITSREMEVLRLMAAGHSNRKIADDLFISVETARWYTKQIYSKLGVHSRAEAIVRAQSMDLDGDAIPIMTTPAAPTAGHKLPPSMTPLIGRDTEIAEVKSLLDQSRLVTLTGPGGTGKTRLALQVAAELADEFAQGVHFIDLASVTDPALVAPAIASAIGLGQTGAISTEEALQNSLREQAALLLIDNFEQVIAAAPFIGDLVANTQQLCILVTSREVLQIYGEQEYPVPPLKLPDLTTRYTMEELAQFPSVDLFIQRAQAVQPSFALDADNAALITEICVRLDGLPLAIELAAARIRLFTPQALLARLDERFKTLTGKAHGVPERQQTLQAAIDWSYNLLDETEQRFFARLGIFSGGRSLEAIEAVCSDGLDTDLFDLLESLLNKSLLRGEEDALGEPRFVMLETIHEYASRRLDESGELETLHRSHAEYFTRLAEQGAPHLRGHQQRYWYARLETEFDNLRAALDWALSGGDYELGGRMVAALADLWYYRTHPEGLEWANRALSITEHLTVNTRIRVLMAAGRLHWIQQHVERGRDLLANALQLAQHQEDGRNIAWASAYYAGVSGYGGVSGNLTSQNDEKKRMMQLGQESLSIFRELEDKPGTAQALNILGELSRTNGDDDTALEYYRKCLDISLETGEKTRVVMQLMNMSFITLRREQPHETWQFMREALAINIEANDYNGITAMAVQTIAGILCAMGQAEQGIQLMGAADRWLIERGVTLLPTDQPEIDRIRDMLREALDEETHERAWQQGAAMSIQQAVELALELLDS